MIESEWFSLNRGELARHILRVIPDLNRNTSRTAPPSSGPAQPPSTGLNHATAPAQSPPTPISNHAQPPIGVVQLNNIVQWKPPPSESTHSHPGNQGAPAYKTPYPHTLYASQTASGPPGHQHPIGSIPYPSQHPGPASANPAHKSSIPHILRDSPGPQRQPSKSSSKNHRGISAQPQQLPKRLSAPSALARAHVPTPGSKEAMARKREFSEIVDLTQQLSDDEDEDLERELKTSRLGDASGLAASSALAASSSLAALSSLAASSGPAASHIGSVSAVLSPPDLEQRPPPKPSSRMDLSVFRRAEDGQGRKESLRRRPDIVQPIDKTEALRTSYYDPKTIARDILIAAGRHPRERPLNAHLSKLQEIFSHVDNSSNLETFRWDLVDPGGPECPNVEPVPIITQPPNLSISQNRTPISQPSSHPPSNAKLGPPRDSPRDSPKRASTSASAKIRGASYHHRPSHLHISETVDQTSTREKVQNTQAPPGMSTSTPPIPGPRRRGRPPKSHPPGEGSIKASANTSTKIEVAVPMRQQPKYHVYECRWDGCTAKLHNLDTLRKHVKRVHVTMNGDAKTPCLWTGCRIRGMGSSPPTFAANELHDHIEKSHYGPLAWNIGDGPLVKINGESGNSSRPIVIL